MYKFLLLITTILASFTFAQVPTQNAYIEDETDFFVAGNKVNDALERVNLLLCYLENTKPTTFVNKGTYVATIFEDDCVFGQAKAGDKQKAEGSQGGTSSSSSSSSGSSSEAKEGKKGNQTFLTVTQADNDSDMIGNIWVQLAKDERNNVGVAADAAMGTAQGGGNPEYGVPYDATVYLKHTQNTPPSATNKLGNFTQNYSLYADAAEVINDFAVGAPPPPGVTDIDITSFDTQQEKINAMNFNLGNGFVSSQDNTIKYKESVGGALQELSITYDGNGGATGIFTHEVFWDETWANSANNPTNTGFGGDGEVTFYYAFVMNETDDWYCELPIQATVIAESALQAIFDFETTTDAELGAIEGSAIETTTINLADTNLGASPQESCYSLSRADAYKNVWSYGVYDAQGERSGGNAGAFPIVAENTGEGDDYYGWADYWGTWVDTYGRGAFDPLQYTWNRDDGSTVGPCSAAGCQLTKDYIRINKFATTYDPLDSIHKITLSIDVGWMQDWFSEWDSVLSWTSPSSTDSNGNKINGNDGTCVYPTDFDDPTNHVCFYNMEGYWDKDLNGEGGFVITHGMKWSTNGDPKIDIVDIEIDANLWAATFIKPSGWAMDIWTWSPDTYQSFNIPSGAISNPQSTTKGSSIKRESYSNINITTLATDLGGDSLSCLSRCLDPAALNTVYKAAADAKVTDDTADDTAFTAVTSTIFDADASRFFIDEANPSFLTEMDGIASSLVATYRIDASGDSLHLADQASDIASANELTIQTTTQDSFAAVTTKFKEPAENFFWDLKAAGNGYNEALGNTYDIEYIGWSARTGYLIPTAAMTDLICDNDGNTPPVYLNDNTDHPRYLSGGLPTAAMSETRYCADKIWSGEVSQYYEVELMMSGNYLLTDGGTPVVIEQPKTLKLDTTTFTTANSGIAAGDIGKTFYLQYEGFGNLWGIPGGTFDTCEGKFLGEYFYGTWDEACHRWTSKFIIPDGSEIIDDNASPSTTLYVKALAGDEFLAKLDNAAVAALPARDYTFADSASKIADVLAPATSLIDMGPNGTDANKIGPVPTADILNNGDPSVSMGTVLVPPAN